MSLFYALFLCMVSCLCGSGAIWADDCCLKINPPGPKLHVKHVVDCKVQKAGLCPFDAIIIKMHKGQTFCDKPQTTWVKRHVVMKGPDSCEIKKKKPKNPKNKKRVKGGKRVKGKRKQGERKSELNVSTTPVQIQYT